MTLSPKERLVLNSYRMTGGQIGVLLMNATALPLVAFLGNGNDKAGFIYTAIVFSVIPGANAICLQKYSRTGYRQNTAGTTSADEKELFGNERQLAVDPDGAGKSHLLIALQQRNTTIVYYLTYNLDRKDLVPLIAFSPPFRF